MAETSSATSTKVGFIGLGDQGLPMAIAVAEAGFPLHVWARRAASLEPLRDTPYTAHLSVGDLAAACDVVALCVGTDQDVLGIVEDGVLGNLRKDSVVVNHGTGTPGNAVHLSQICEKAGVHALDAPVSGGRPGAEARALTTMVGGEAAIAARCEPVFSSFSAHVVHMGAAGSGQSAKLFNNALLIMNQANIAEIFSTAADYGLEVTALFEVLKLGSASSSALTLLNTMVKPENVEHLSGVEGLDMEIFDTAMTEAGVDAGSITVRGRAGAAALPDLIARLNP